MARKDHSGLEEEGKAEPERVTSEPSGCDAGPVVKISVTRSRATRLYCKLKMIPLGTNKGVRPHSVGGRLMELIKPSRAGLGGRKA